MCVGAAALALALVVALAGGLPDSFTRSGPLLQPTQLPPHGGPLTAGERDSSCYATDATLCGGNGLSVLSVDVLRSRFLVVWNESLTREENGVATLDKVMARFVSSTGRIGPKMLLAGDARSGDPLSVQYQRSTDRFIVSWNRSDHYLAAATLAVISPQRRSAWSADRLVAARDPNVRIWGHRRGQRGRIPQARAGLAIWDSTDGMTSQVFGQILPPGRTCQGHQKCEPLGPA